MLLGATMSEFVQYKDSSHNPFMNEKRRNKITTPEPPEKACRTCGIVKAVELFPLASRPKGYHIKDCRVCYNHKSMLRAREVRKVEPFNSLLSTEDNYEPALHKQYLWKPTDRSMTDEDSIE